MDIPQATDETSWRASPDEAGSSDALFNLRATRVFDRLTRAGADLNTAQTFYKEKQAREERARKELAQAAIDLQRAASGLHETVKALHEAEGVRACCEEALQGVEGLRRRASASDADSPMYPYTEGEREAVARWREQRTEARAKVRRLGHEQRQYTRPRLEPRPSNTQSPQADRALPTQPASRCRWTIETERHTQRTLDLAEEADAAVWSSPAGSPQSSSPLGSLPVRVLNDDDRMGDLPVRVLKVEVQRRKQRVGAAEVSRPHTNPRPVNMPTPIHAARSNPAARGGGAGAQRAGCVRAGDGPGRGVVRRSRGGVNCEASHVHSCIDARSDV